MLNERFLSISFYNAVKPKDKVVGNIVDALNEIEGSRIGTRVVVPSVTQEFDRSEVLILLQSYGYRIVKDHKFDLINILKVKRLNVVLTVFVEGDERGDKLFIVDSTVSSLNQMNVAYL